MKDIFNAPVITTEERMRKHMKFFGQKYIRPKFIKKLTLEYAYKAAIRDVMRQIKKTMQNGGAL